MALSFLSSPYLFPHGSRVIHRYQSPKCSIPPPPLFPFTPSPPAIHAPSTLCASERRRQAIIQEAVSILRDRYVNASNINWKRVTRRVERRRLRSDDDLQSALISVFSEMRDPFTRYLSAEELKGMKDDMEGRMSGVGVVLESAGLGGVVVKEVVKGSPAGEAGLKKGDRITAIDLKETSDMEFEEVMRRLMGKEGGKVNLGFCRGKGEGKVELCVTLKRRRFEMPSVGMEVIERDQVGKVGYIRVREFAMGTGKQVRKAVRKMKRMEVGVIVLDMRGNSGGLVDKAVEVAQVFVGKEETVVRFEGREGGIKEEKGGGGKGINIPVVVVVDRETASASELVAAAVKENCRGVIVGEWTFGKGSVQAIVGMSDGSGVAVTVAKYITPNGTSIGDGRGIRPDWKKEIVSDEEQRVVDGLFGGRAGKRRYKWMMGKLDKCRQDSQCL